MSLELHVHHDFQELDENLIAFWRMQQKHPYGDLDYANWEYANRREEWIPHILSIRDQGEIVSCAFGKIQKLPVKLQFGYKVLRGPSLRTLVVHRSGFIGNWNEFLYSFLHQQLRDMLSSGAIDALLLRMIPLESPLYHIVQRGIPFLQRNQFPIVQEYWLLKQPPSFSEFLKCHPNLKKHYKYYRNRLNRAFSNKVEVHCYCSPDEMERMLRDSEEIGRKTWQRRLGDASFLADMERSRYRFYFGKGWCRGYVLYLDQVPAALVHGIAYRDAFYVLKLGYDPSYRNLSVGTFLLLHVIKELCGNANIRTLDFNAGNDEAKRQYCDSSFKVSAIQLFGPGLRLWIPILLHLAAQGSHQLAKAISHRMRSYHAIRARWRYGG